MKNSNRDLFNENETFFMKQNHNYRKYGLDMKIKFTKNKWLVYWAIASIILMVSIHILFHIDGPNWLDPRWSAGEILTYCGTTSLSLLAVWQNKRFKEENDKSQERLEQISNKANELSMLSRILEYEEHRRERLDVALRQFSDCANGTHIFTFAREGKLNQDTAARLSSLAIELDKCFYEAFRELKKDEFIDNFEFQNLLIAYYTDARNMIQMLALPGDENTDELADSLIDERLKYNELLVAYTTASDKFYSHLLYDNLSLEEIRALKKEKGQKNG